MGACKPVVVSCEEMYITASLPTLRGRGPRVRMRREAMSVMMGSDASVSLPHAWQFTVDDPIIASRVIMRESRRKGHLRHRSVGGRS